MIIEEQICVLHRVVVSLFIGIFLYNFIFLDNVVIRVFRDALNAETPHLT